MSGELTRANLVREARLQVEEGAHYIKKGFGQKHDLSGSIIDGGVPGRERAVRLITNRVTVPGVPPYVRFAAWSDFNGRRVCAGRCYEYQLSPPPTGDPDDPAHVRAPIPFAWLRPENYANSTSQVLGECCVGRRHFDCFGFVNWCYWRALGAHFPGNPAYFGIPLWRSRCRMINRISETVVPGDILFLDSRHMGMAISATEVAHSAGYFWGVQITGISVPIYPHLRSGGVRWDMEVGRPRILDSMP